MFSSTIQILKVDPVEKKNPPGGTPYEVHSAQCLLLDDNGELQTVGRLSIPPDLRGKVQVGTYRASFALQTAAYGKQKGDIVASLTGLVPVQSKAPAAAPKPV